MTTKSVTKQLFINRLQSPEDLQSLIKDFCFYDTKSWETIQFIKSKKNRINHLLKNASISRANPDDFFLDGPDTDEHWAFYVYDEEDGENPQFQSVNCSLCGNYVATSIHIPEKIQCKCEYHDIHDDDEYDDLTITSDMIMGDHDDYDYDSSDDYSFDE
jgi:hypothetical protein